MSQLSQRINFYKDSFRKPVIKLPLQKMMGVWAAVFVLLFVVSVLDSMHTYNEKNALSQMEQARDKMEASIAKLQQRVDALVLDKNLEQQEKRLRLGLQSKRSFLQDLQQQGDTHQVEFSAYLQALANMESRHVWLTRIRMQSPGPQVFLSGVTNKPKSIPEYLENLKTQQSFEGMGFKVFNLEREEDNQDYLTFHVGTQHDEATAN